MRNYFRFSRVDDQYLITNEFGRYAFLPADVFEDLKHNRIHSGHPFYDELSDSFFLFDDDPELFFQRVEGYSRSSRRYLFAGTSLFIFVLTNQCNMSCRYCQANSPLSQCVGMMSEETARKAVDLVFSSPAKFISIEFQGGEPLINWHIITVITEYAERLAETADKQVQFSLVSNLLLLDDEMVQFIKAHNIDVSTSLDGDSTVHDFNRRLRSGGGTFDKVAEKIAFLQKNEVRPGAIETTTAKTLSNPRALIDTYVSLGLNSVFLRPLTPLGVAQKNWDTIGYTPDQFIEFYRICIDYLLELNKNGTYISEGHASIFLGKILFSDSANYMELRSPCGAGIGQMAFNYDGGVYTCDEARMLAEQEDESFRLGTVDSKYDELIDNEVCKTVCSASVLDSIPECCECVYQPYCGTCPVVNYALYGDIFVKTPNNYRCRLYKGILNVLFSIIRRNDPDDMEVLKSWCTGRSIDL